ncbi:hypothetical protein D477_013020 [Arthrobacter crystallopoietes BAB-32]|uniref:Uncharacterized protein n=1 Tax=Arthrobacter crystallopoietes BAB-32 TaxID=1246476 RepID=N1V1D2_9MICC|nr:hypothetical protein [Arthrobacter crystallopoietes]EMY33784.1 hypothetical protein D477_013020 [Arthrobacter crystallopoietes BAB-32]
MPEMTVEASAADFVSEVVPQILLIGGTVMLAFTLAAAVACWLVVRRIRRSRKIQRNMRKGQLMVRLATGDQSKRQLARLRLQLQRSTEATERSLTAASGQGRPVGELPAVALNLSKAEQALDAQLHLAEREPDPQLRRALLPGLQKQVEQLCGLGSELRQSVLQTGHSISTARMQQVGSHLAMELDALQTWNRSYNSHHRQL